MTRKTKRAITMTVSLVLILALGGIYFWQQQQEEELALPPPVLPTFEHLVMRTANEVASVTFLHASGESYTMVPAGEVMSHTGFPVFLWEHTNYPDFILDNEIARGKTNMAWGVTASDTIHECYTEVNLADFGLNPPQLTLQVTFNDNTHTNVYIGSQTSDHMGYFIMVSDDNAIYRIGNAPVNRAMATIEDMIDRYMPEINMHATHIRIAQRDMPEIELILSLEAMYHLLQGLFPENPLGFHLMMAQPLEEWELMHDSLEMHLITPLEHFRLGPLVSLAPTNLANYGLDNPSMEFFFANFVEDVHLLFGDVFMYNDIPHIYVKFADRPHVFRAPYQTMNVLFDFDIFRIINRIVALIPITDVESVMVTTPDSSVELVMNHSYPNDIEPTINGVYIADHRAFRTAYRLLIGISGEGEIETHTPTVAPDITIMYNKIEGPPTEVRLFAVDNNFYAISLNGEEAWRLTSRRGVNTFFEFVENLLDD